jgi:hypothetical protein
MTIKMMQESEEDMAVQSERVSDKCKTFHFSDPVHDALAGDESRNSLLHPGHGALLNETIGLEAG